MTEYKYKVSIEAETEDDLRSLLGAISEQVPSASTPAEWRVKDPVPSARAFTVEPRADEVEAFSIIANSADNLPRQLTLAVTEYGLRISCDGNQLSIHNSTMAYALDAIICVLTYLRKHTHEGVAIKG